MKLALFTSNVHEQHLPYKVYGKVDFHFNKSESKEKKKNPPKLQLKLLKYLNKFTNTYTYINHITCTRSITKTFLQSCVRSCRHLFISEGHSMTYRRLTTKSGITFQHHV